MTYIAENLFYSRHCLHICIRFMLLEEIWWEIKNNGGVKSSLAVMWKMFLNVDKRVSTAYNNTGASYTMDI